MDARESLEKNRIVVILESPSARAMGIPNNMQIKSSKKRAPVVIS